MFEMDLPVWACWLAMDADGNWWCYEVEPHQHHQGWYENEVGRNRKLGQGVGQQPDWRNSLLRIAIEKY